MVLAPDRSRLGALPSPGRESIVALAASFMPYYAPAGEWLAALPRFPRPRGGQTRSQPPSPGSPPPAGLGSGPGALDPGARLLDPELDPPDPEAIDFVLDCVADTLSRVIRTEGGRLRYLDALAALQGTQYLGLVRTITRLRLQVRGVGGCMSSYAR